LPREGARRRSLSVRWLATVLGVMLANAAVHAAVHAEAPSRAQIEVALAQLRADPNLGTEHQERRLQWNFKNEPPQQDMHLPNWIVGLFEFLGQSLSVALWVAGGLLVAVAAVWTVRALRARRATARAAPASVEGRHELDLSPASLPDDIGSAALAALEAGLDREALSLLYRGALARAVHLHGVRIEASATESEALSAVRSRLDGARRDYFTELVALWQSMVYAGAAVPREAIARLCARFAPVLEASAA